MKNPALSLKPAQMRLACAIDEHRKLQLAAEALGMSQPAASRMLAEIEARLGAALFLRQPTGMVPTEIGHAVLRRARVVMRELAQVGMDVAALKAGHAGSVRIGAVTGPAISALVSAIREVKAEAPAAEITVDVLPSRELLQLLSAGEMDFVLGRILPEFSSVDLTILPLRDERVSFLTRAGHPLAGLERVTLAQLADLEWVMQARGAPIREAAVQALAGIGLPEPRNIISTPSLLFTIAYLAEGDGVAPMSDEVADLLTGPPISAGLARLALTPVIRVPPYYLISPRRRPMSPLAMRLRDAVVDHASRGGALTPTDAATAAAPS